MSFRLHKRSPTMAAACQPVNLLHHWHNKLKVYVSVTNSLKHTQGCFIKKGAFQILSSTKNWGHKLEKRRPVYVTCFKRRRQTNEKHFPLKLLMMETIETPAWEYRRGVLMRNGRHISSKMFSQLLNGIKQWGTTKLQPPLFWYETYSPMNTNGDFSSDIKKVITWYKRESFLFYRLAVNWQMCSYVCPCICATWIWSSQIRYRYPLKRFVSKIHISFLNKLRK